MLLATIRDITERKAAAEELDRLFTLSLDLLCVAGFDGYFKRLNPAWEKKLDFTTEELMAKPYLEFVHPEDRESTVAEAQWNKATHSEQNSATKSGGIRGMRFYRELSNEAACHLHHSSWACSDPQ